MGAFGLSLERMQEMLDFGSVTLSLSTELPAQTDADIEARYEEFADFRDRLEALLEQAVNLVPAGWKATVDDEWKEYLMPDEYISKDLNPRMQQTQLGKVYAQMQVSISQHVLTLRGVAEQLEHHPLKLADTEAAEARELATKLQVLNEQIVDLGVRTFGR